MIVWSLFGLVCLLLIVVVVVVVGVRHHSFIPVWWRNCDLILTSFVLTLLLFISALHLLHLVVICWSRFTFVVTFCLDPFVVDGNICCCLLSAIFIQPSRLLLAVFLAVTSSSDAMRLGRREQTDGIPIAVPLLLLCWYVRLMTRWCCCWSHCLDGMARSIVISGNCCWPYSHFVIICICDVVVILLLLFPTLIFVLVVIVREVHSVRVRQCLLENILLYDHCCCCCDSVPLRWHSLLLRLDRLLSVVLRYFVVVCYSFDVPPGTSTAVVIRLINDALCHCLRRCLICPFAILQRFIVVSHLRWRWHLRCSALITFPVVIVADHHSCW